MSDQPRIVFALTSGDYSDYRVHAIYSTYATAAAEAERVNATPKHRGRDACEVQTFLMDPTPEQLDAVGGVEIEINEKGEIVASQYPRYGVPVSPFEPPREYTVWRTLAETEAGMLPARHFVGYGTDVESARRAADEYRCMVLMAEQPASAK